jgi:hypothetical protein
MEVNPAIVIGVGTLAEDIIGYAKKFILQRTRHTSVPSVFQFLTVGADQTNVEGVIAQAYYAAADKNAALEAEQSSDLHLNSSRVESFVIAPLREAEYETAMRAARALKNCSHQRLAGGRNAVFLLPKRRLQQDSEALQNTARDLDSEIQSQLSFNRCFFVDEVDELGRSIGEGEVVELVARFISLAIASELSRPLRTVPPPYIGNGPHHRCYASFSCSTIGFDAQRLIEVLSDHLARDIRQRLFIDRDIKLDETGWPEKARLWLKESLDKPLTDPPGIELADIRRDADFIYAKERLDEFARSAYISFSSDFHTYQRLIDCCLTQGIVELESLSKKMADTKKEINQTEIKIMLGHACGAKSDSIETVTNEKPWPLIITLGLAGFTLIIAPLVATNFQPATIHTLGIAVGGLLILIAAALAIVGRGKIVLSGRTTPTSCAAELERQKRQYKEQNKRQNIHVALFTYLDLAYANLEDLRRMVIEPGVERERSIFDVDLIDAELAKKFYDREYKNKDRAVASFATGQQSDGAYDSAFSLFKIKLSDCLRKYCNGYLGDIRNFDLEQMFRLRESLSSYRELQTASSPFWYPRDSAESEKLVLAIIPEQSPDGMRTLLSNTFGAHNINYFYGQEWAKATLIQVAYGQQLNNILGHPSSNSNLT